jgi:ribose-phosphate pyrophosphokinase
MAKPMFGLYQMKDKKVFLVCTLDQPDTKLLPLYFLAKTAKEFGAKSICLIAPYLAYMPGQSFQ